MKTRKMVLFFFFLVQTKKKSLQKSLASFSISGNEKKSHESRWLFLVERVAGLLKRHFNDQVSVWMARFDMMFNVLSVGIRWQFDLSLQL